MQASLKKIVVGSLFLAGTCVVAVVGYWLSGWSLVDSIYMVIITTFGVGYGEVQPITEPGLKIFTMVVIVVGCSALIYVTGGFIQMVTEGEINRALGTRRKAKGIDKLKGHAIVCGFGRVGRILAAELKEAGHEFVVIDASPERVRDAEAAACRVVSGNATEEETLRIAGIARARVLATVLPDDAANVFITLTARDLSQEIEIIARAEHPSTERKLLRSGATRVVMPSAIGASKIRHLITNPSGDSLLGKASSHIDEDLRQIGLQMRELELPPDSPFVDRPLAECAITGVRHFVIVAVVRPGGELLRNPGPQVVLQVGDRILVVASAKELPEVIRGATDDTGMLYRGVRH
jgi:voltage-gated potassium channel